jgi:hypothetical protein
VDPGLINSKVFITVGELLKIAINCSIVSGKGSIDGNEKLLATSPSTIKAKFGLSSVNGLKVISSFDIVSPY